MKPLQSMCKRNLTTAGKPPRARIWLSFGTPLNIFLWTALLVVFATLPSPSQGESLGRLFFTPDERGNFDRARLSGGNIEQEGSADQQLESLSLNGIVKRSSGKSTVWINNLAQNEIDFPLVSKRQTVKTRLPDFPVLVQKTGKTVILKVGQTLNIDSGEIREIYQPSIVKEPPPAPSAAAEQSTQQGRGTKKTHNS